MKYISIATSKGLKKLLSASTGGKPIKLTTAKLGDGGGVEYTPTEFMSDLKNTVYETTPNSVGESNESESWSIIELVVPHDTDPFWVREIGLCDDEGDLIYIANCPPRYKPNQPGVDVDMSFEISIYVGNSNNIELIIDPNKAVATQSHVEKEIEKHSKKGDHDSIYSRNFRTVYDLKLGIDASGQKVDMSSLVGDKVFWRGYYAESDGGSNWGIVKSGPHVDDGFSIFSIDAITYVQSNQITNSVNFKKGGAKGDDLFVNDEVFKTVLAYANANKIPRALLTSGLFRTDTPTLIPGGVTFKSYNQSGVKFLTGSGVYFSQIRYYGTGPCLHIKDNTGPNSIVSYSAATVDSVQMRYYGASQATAYGIQIGTLAKEALQSVVKNCLIQGFGRGVYNIGSWNVQVTDTYIYSTVNPDQKAAPLTFGIYIDCEVRNITSNYLTRVFVQSCDVGFYVQGAASYSGMTDVYTDACNTGYWFNGANASPGRGWSIKGLGLEAPKYKGMVVNSTNIDITGFSFVKGISSTYETILQAENNASVSLLGGDDIPTGSYGTVNGMSVSADSHLSIRDVLCAPELMIDSQGSVIVSIKTQHAYGGLIRWPALVETIGFGNRNNQRKGYENYVWLPDGVTQSVPTTTGLTTPTFDVSKMSVGDRITITNVALIGSGHNINLRDELQTGFAQSGIIKNPADTSGITIQPADTVTLIKQSDGKLHKIATS